VTPPISYADLQRMPVLMVYLVAFQNGFFWKKLSSSDAGRCRMRAEIARPT